MPQLCTFRLADLYLAVDVLDVQEVLRQREMTEVPLTPRAIRGLINLRGQIVTAIDLRIRMGLPEAGSDVSPYNLVVRTEDGVVSLLVDSMGDVLDIAEDRFEPLPATVQGTFREVLCGVSKLDGLLLLVLDLEKAVTIAPEA